MFAEFKKFIMKGNAVDLAVAVVIGAAFGAIVTALVQDIVTPLIAAIGGQPDFSNLHLTINKSSIRYGDFLNAVVSFLLIAGVIFFLVIQPVNRLTSIANNRKSTPEPTEKKCPECLSTIPKAATRCSYCTSKVG